MAAEPQDFEPEKLTAGVTWKWKKTHSDYPASEWTLTYYLRKDGATATSFTGTAKIVISSCFIFLYILILRRILLHGRLGNQRFHFQHNLMVPDHLYLLHSHPHQP